MQFFPTTCHTPKKHAKHALLIDVSVAPAWRFSKTKGAVCAALSLVRGTKLRSLHVTGEDMEHELTWLRGAYEHWRLVAGSLSCKLTGVGPTGGFCMNSSSRGNNECMPTQLADFMGELFRGSSVLDMGCGLGQYGRHFANRSNLNISWLGVDGSEGIEAFTNGFVKFADLSQEVLPIAVRRPSGFAWTMSIEVAEHVARDQEAVFVHHLASQARVGIVLSWATLGQAGHHHVNCVDAKYVACVMELVGFDLDKQSTSRARDRKRVAPCSWLAFTLSVFRRRDPSHQRGQREVNDSSPLFHRSSLTPLPLFPTAAFRARYEQLTSERCVRLDDGCNHRYHQPGGGINFRGRATVAAIRESTRAPIAARDLGK